MIPGPNYVYKCPKCGNLLTRGSLMSGNTSGAEIFSDGKSIAPMLLEFPTITKCSKCDTILWLSKMKEIGSYEWGECDNADWKNAENVEFLEIKDYNRVLSERLYDDSEELFVRLQILWAYNDRVRNGSNLFENDEDKSNWEHNCYKLISLLDESELDQLILIAELKRNLGEFESCIEIVNKIDDENISWIRKQYIKECKKRNSLVIKLK